MKNIIINKIFFDYFTYVLEVNINIDPNQNPSFSNNIYLPCFITIHLQISILRSGHSEKMKNSINYCINELKGGDTVLTYLLIIRC
jgi:hypothetical protein